MGKTVQRNRIARWIILPLPIPLFCLSSWPCSPGFLFPCPPFPCHPSPVFSCGTSRERRVSVPPTLAKVELNGSPRFSLDRPGIVLSPVVAASGSLAEGGALWRVPQASRLWLRRARIVASCLARLSPFSAGKGADRACSAPQVFPAQEVTTLGTRRNAKSVSLLAGKTYGKWRKSSLVSVAESRARSSGSPRCLAKPLRTRL